MSTTEWITDREPTSADAPMNYIIIWEDRWQIPVVVDYGDWHKRHPWMPIAKPEPYVKPKRYVVVEYYDCGTWTVQDTKELCLVCRPLPTREAAEEFAAIYERMMP